MSTIILATLWTLATGAPPPDAPPVAVFAELDRVWEGTLVGYDAEGRPHGVLTT
jgi:hypothetical protein